MYLIVDGSSLLSTCYYGTLPKQMLFAKTEEEKAKYYGDILQTSDGKYTNGVFASLRQLLKIIKYQKPEGIAVVFDASRKTFRTEIYEQYKGQRSETPHPLKEQFLTFETLLEDIGIPTFYSSEYEADDYAGSIVKTLEKQGKQCVMLSGDKDYYQLVSKDTKLWRIVTSTARPKYEKIYGIDLDQYRLENNLPHSVFEITDTTGVIAEKENVHLSPSQFVDYLAVVGDKADNIPGVPNVGPMTIIPLLQRYGSLNNIYDVIEKAVRDGKAKELTQLWKEQLGIKKSPIASLTDHKDDAELSRQLATIKTDVPVENNAEFYDLHINKDSLQQAINRYEMQSLTDLL